MSSSPVTEKEVPREALPTREGSKKKRRKSKKDEDRKDKDTESEAALETKGVGSFIYPTGATYEGEWEKFGDVVKRHGKGVYTEGNYSYDGIAYHLCKESENFQGEWKEDQMQGVGTFRYASGAMYQGEWNNNKYCGKGRYVFPDGSSYEGQWQDNKMHGIGCFTDKQGVQFRGQFYNNSGPGLTTWYT